LGQEARSQTFFAFKLRNGNAAIGLDRVVLDPRAEKVEGRIMNWMQGDSDDLNWIFEAT
jgi:hypothetical protein